MIVAGNTGARIPESTARYRSKQANGPALIPA
jgi:hypothetical protein